ncbi:MAG: TerB family tellurite resistance protein [Rhodocyclaceae bacterium]
MTPEERKALLAIALYAAFADGVKDDREREELRRVAATLDVGQVMALIRA